MSASYMLSKDQRALLVMVLTFWLENIAQEDTNQDDYVAIHSLREMLRDK